MPYNTKPYRSGGMNKQKSQANSLRSGSYKRGSSMPKHPPGSHTRGAPHDNPHGVGYMAEMPEYAGDPPYTSHSTDGPYQGKAHDASGKWRKNKMKQPAHAQGASHDNPHGGETQYRGSDNPHPYGKRNKRGGSTNGIGSGGSSGGGVGGAT